MKSSEIRSSFLKFFEEHNHLVLPSSSLVPHDDPTLLFTNAGMNQFKGIFLGLEKPPHPRAVTSQKCVRAGGKHNDLENVGFTARHHTFFEMLGNFSFGDYFKKEAIRYSWEFLTKTLGLPKDRLYITVFETDDEAADIWHKQEGVPKDRIYRFGEADNFWRMGETGPCGPCSEIFWDHGPEADEDPTRPSQMGGDGDRFVEIWNLVFMQFNEDAQWKLTPLPRPCVDTGAGLERLAAVLQQTNNNYDTDAFLPIFEAISKLTGVSYIKSREERRSADPKLKADMAAMRVVADHARAAAFLIGDGVTPSNEGRGYVLRRIMRRAIRFGRQLTPKEELYPTAVRSVIDLMSDAYPELKAQKNLIFSSVSDEVTRFLKTLDQGTEVLETHLSKLKAGDTLPGDLVFKLYDTFGFPVDLTRLMAKERGLNIDEVEFERQKEASRKLARASWKGSRNQDEAHALKEWASGLPSPGTEHFSGYDKLSESGKIISLFSEGKEVSHLKEDTRGYALISPTCFYAESGGQVGDQGTILGSQGRALVEDCQKINNLHILSLHVDSGTISAGDVVQQETSEALRRATAAHHSATHLLHSALRATLGPHVRQAGSLVDSRRLRFDFNHSEALNPEQIQTIETLVNDQIVRAIPVEASTKSYDEALKAGALAMFGEKYGDEVRVLSMGDFSSELCGGTHVRNTSEIRIFKIVSETGVSAGVRRIEALAGSSAHKFFLNILDDYNSFKGEAGIVEGWSQVMEGPKALKNWLQKTRDHTKSLEQEVRRAQSSSFDLDRTIKEARPLKDHPECKWAYAEIPSSDRNVLSEISDKMKNKLGKGVVIVVSGEGPNHALVVSVSQDLIASLKAGNIVKELARIHGGKGGGRPDFAQGALNQINSIEKTLASLL